MLHISIIAIIPGYPHNPYNGVICNDVIAASGVFTTKELWKYSKGKLKFIPDIEYPLGNQLFGPYLITLINLARARVCNLHSRADKSKSQ